MSASLSADARKPYQSSTKPPYDRQALKEHDTRMAIFSIPILMTWLQPQNPDVKEVGWDP